MVSQAAVPLTAMCSMGKALIYRPLRAKGLAQKTWAKGTGPLGWVIRDGGGLGLLPLRADASHCGQLRLVYMFGVCVGLLGVGATLASLW